MANNNNKLPVTLLKEHCDKNKSQFPLYNVPSSQMMEMDKKFFTAYVHAMGQTGCGQGSSKIIAKHRAAANLMEKLGISVDYSPELEENTVDAKSKLLDLCVSHNIPIARFSQIQVTGGSHCPEFTMQCTVGNFRREATAATKKMAERKAAMAMLDILNHQNNIQTIQTVDLEIAEEEDISVMRTYREYRKQKVKNEIGVKLKDRHNFFLTLGDEALTEARKLLQKESVPVQERFEDALKVLKLKYNIQDDNEICDEPVKTFELLHDHFNCFLLYPSSSFWNALYEYFTVMLYDPVTYNENSKLIRSHSLSKL